MPSPIDALTIRTIVAEQLRGVTFGNIIDSFMDDMDRRGFTDVGRPQVGNRSSHPMKQQVFRSGMAIAETFYLSADMQTLALAASTADDFPDDEAILVEDAPSDAGFLVFEKPFEMVELRGKVMLAHAVVWLRNRVWWLCDRKDPNDEMTQELRAQFDAKSMEYLFRTSRYDLCSIDQFNYNEPMPTTYTLPKGVIPDGSVVTFERDSSGDLQMCSSLGFLLPDGSRVQNSGTIITRWDGSAIGSGLHTMDGQDFGKLERNPNLKFLLTVWRLMQQTLSEVIRDESADKSTRRYAQRAGITDTAVQVIQLRRRKSNPTGSGAPLDHRVPVRGHWRRVWCGPADDRTRRAVYIHPYIKGPDDAPLIVREKVNALVR